MKSMSKIVARLVKQFIPIHYDVSLFPDRNKMIFSGEILVTGTKTGRPAKRIVLHQKYLKIKNTTLHFKDKKNGWHEIPVIRINTHNKFDELRIHTDKLLNNGEYRLSIKFSGKITDSMHGIYPSYFQDKDIKKSLISTQFESHHAREAIPCIDEPDAKATFKLTLTSEKKDIVLSNTPIEKITKLDKSLVKTEFQTTPRMSSYLLAFVIGELHGTEKKTKDGVLVKTWSTIIQPISSLEYANNEAVKILEYFTDYFQTPFPLPKCDQVALPDFESGAMENWGLITYREIALLCEKQNRSLSSEQYVSMVVGHEMSHQWFGNLVTMKWWDDLWLNESFAGIMEHIVLDALHPDWNQWEQYMLSDVIYTTSRDVYKDVQPVRMEVKNPEAISTMFDPAILYIKGGRLIRMLIEYVGNENFKKGMKLYFAKYSYQNTDRNNLWEILSKASNKDVHNFMDPWLNQSGMPMVTVTAHNNELKLSQKRLLLDGDDTKSLWPIPLLSNIKLKKEILEDRHDSQDSNKASNVILNINGSGHYIVNYADKKMRAELASEIAAQKLPTEARINILNDLLLLSRAGEASITDALEIVLNCQHETREAVWGMIARIVGTSMSLIDGDDKSEEKLKLIRRKLATNNYKKLGWDNLANDTANDILLRQTTIGLLIAGEDKSVIFEAENRFNKVKDIVSLRSEQRVLILTSMIRHSKKDILDDLLKIYQKSSNPEIQLAICAAVTETRDPKKIKHIINKSLGINGFVRPQDIFRWFAYLMRNRYSRDQAWDWMVNNWQRLEETMGDSKVFDDFPVYAAAPLNTSSWQSKYVEFFTPLLNNPVLERNIKVGMADIEAKVKWRIREEPKLKKYLAALPNIFI